MHVLAVLLLVNVSVVTFAHSKGYASFLASLSLSSLLSSLSSREEGSLSLVFPSFDESTDPVVLAVTSRFDDDIIPLLQ